MGKLTKVSRSKVRNASLAQFTLEFRAASGAAGVERHTLDAETLEEAKAKAATLYAGASFRRSPPTSYRILSPLGTEAYRFPERR